MSSKPKVTVTSVPLMTGVDDMTVFGIRQERR